MGEFIFSLFGKTDFILIYVPVWPVELEGVGAPVARGTGKREPLMWCWELNAGSREGQQGLLPARCGGAGGRGRQISVILRST